MYSVGTSLPTATPTRYTHRPPPANFTSHPIPSHHITSPILVSEVHDLGFTALWEELASNSHLELNELPEISCNELRPITPVHSPSPVSQDAICGVSPYGMFESNRALNVARKYALCMSLHPRLGTQPIWAFNPLAHYIVGVD